MKKLGLIGGTGPESTVVYYRELIAGVQKRSGTPVCAPICIDSLDVFKVLSLCDEGNYAGLAAYLAEGIRNLTACGADYAALTGITVHAVYEELQKASPIPIISMVDTAKDYALARGFRRIALLGTLPTMNGCFFPAPFEQAGISVVTPEEEEKRFIAAKIESELEFGILKEETRARMKEIALRLIREEGAEAVVLGCTELPLIFEGVELPAEKMDVMRIHIDALVEKICG